VVEEQDREPARRIGKLIATMPFYPYNLGEGYNRIMDMLDTDDWAVLMDNDVMLTTDSWYFQLMYAIENYPDADMFTAMTNRLAWKGQVVNPVEENLPHIGHTTYVSEGSTEDILYHKQVGYDLLREYGGQAFPINVTCGMFMCLSKRLWLDLGGFRNGLFEVDCNFMSKMKNAGKSLFVLPGLYVYHFHRKKMFGGRDVRDHWTYVIKDLRKRKRQ